MPWRMPVKYSRLIVPRMKEGGLTVSMAVLWHAKSFFLFFFPPLPCSKEFPPPHLFFFNWCIYVMAFKAKNFKTIILQYCSNYHVCFGYRSTRYGLKYMYLEFLFCFSSTSDG